MAQLITAGLCFSLWQDAARFQLVSVLGVLQASKLAFKTSKDGDYPKAGT